MKWTDNIFAQDRESKCDLDQRAELLVEIGLLWGTNILLDALLQFPHLDGIFQRKSFILSIPRLKVTQGFLRLLSLGDIEYPHKDIFIELWLKAVFEPNAEVLKFIRDQPSIHCKIDVASLYARYTRRFDPGIVTAWNFLYPRRLDFAAVVCFELRNVAEKSFYAECTELEECIYFRVGDMYDMKAEFILLTGTATLHIPDQDPRPRDPDTWLAGIHAYDDAKTLLCFLATELCLAFRGVFPTYIILELMKHLHPNIRYALDDLDHGETKGLAHAVVCRIRHYAEAPVRRALKRQRSEHEKRARGDGAN